MDYANLNQASWSTFLPTFKVLLRPASAAAPHISVDDEFAALPLLLEQARAQVSDVGSMADALVPLVFEGYQEWFSYEDQWILSELAEVLDDNGEQENLILLGLDDILGVAKQIDEPGELTDEELEAEVKKLDVATPTQMFLASLGRCVTAWQSQARAIGALQHGSAKADQWTGDLNANWADDSIPGTRYWIYHEDRYLYSDQQVAPLDRWASMPAREGAAEKQQKKWDAEPGWYCTPVDEQFLADYAGVGYVFRFGSDGPWMTLPGAQEAIAKAQAGGAGAGSAERTGELNEHWADNSIPGTRHWILHEDSYLYSDARVAPLTEWWSLPARVRAAEDQRTDWDGAPDWSCTPVDGRFLADYDNTGFVFAHGSAGSWMTLPRAQEAIAKAQAEQVSKEEFKAKVQAEFAKLESGDDPQMQRGLARIRAAGVHPDATDEQLMPLLLAAVAEVGRSQLASPRT